VSFLDDVLIEDIVLAAAALPVMSGDAIYARFALVVLFRIPKPRVWEFVHNPLLGKRPEGRERILSETEELAVLNYVQECQQGFNCVDSFVCKNNVFREKLTLGKHLRIEEVRLKACQYGSFNKYFDDLVKLVKDKNFDPDLIVNFDESTASAAGTLRVTTSVTR
jgi:hypothetical protein